MSEKWDKRMLELARLVATWSKDPSTQVGCVIATAETHQVLGLGYNGFPRGVADKPDRYEDKIVKYRMIVHSEANAILAASQLGQLVLCGSTLYTTKMPCTECSKLIIQAGIGLVVFERPPEGDASVSRWAEDAQWSRQMLSEAGIGVQEV